MENEIEKKSDKWLPISIILAAALIGGAVIYSTKFGTQNVGNSQSQEKQQIIDSTKTAPEIGDDVVLGDANAAVTVFEFGDYQCPFCARLFSDSEPRIREEYIQTGKVKMVYKDLAFLGPESVAAAEAAECAKDQGKYWAYHDELYKTEISDGKANGNSEGNGNLRKNLFINIASTLEMDTRVFESCIDSRKYKAEVEGDEKEAQQLGVNSTPQIFVNDQKLAAGAQPYSVIKAAIDTALQGK